MGITLRFAGGPADGRTLVIPNDSPPPLYLIPEAPPIADIFSASVESTPIGAAEYEPLRERGWPRRADDGSYLYGYRAAPATPEQRAALEQARHQARAAEESRAAELDATWREIREQRPHYPTDWRDL